LISEVQTQFYHCAKPPLKDERFSALTLPEGDFHGKGFYYMGAIFIRSVELRGADTGRVLAIPDSYRLA
jgi:hypothetical protein